MPVDAIKKFHYVATSQSEKIIMALAPLQGITSAETQVELMYVAYFGRAGDPTGVNFWVNNLNAGQTIDQVAANFALQPESQALYPFLAFPTLNSDAFRVSFIDSIYQNLFNRAPDAAGQTYWDNELAHDQATLTGTALATAIGEFVLEVARGAQNSPDGQDITTMTDKAVVAQYFTDQLTAHSIIYTPGENPTLDALAHSVVAATDSSDTATVAAEEAVIDNFIAHTPGSTFTLTTGVDSGPAFVGTANDDTYNAITVGGQDTLTALDSLDGAGGTDTLNIVSTLTSGTFTAIPTTATLANIEIINVTTLTTGNVHVTVGDNVTGATTLNVDDEGTGSSGDVDVVTKGNIATVSVTAAVPTSGNGHTVDVHDTGATNTLASVSLDGFGFGSTIESNALTTLSLSNSTHHVMVTDTTAGALAVTVDNLTGGAQLQDDTATSMSIAATGEASTLALAANDITTLALSGDQDLTLSSLTTPDLTAIVSTNTSGVTITLPLGPNVSFAGGDGDDSVSVGATTKAITFGAGNDTLTVSTEFGAGGSADGGTGTNTLHMTAAVAATLSADTTFEGVVSNFQALSLDANVAGDVNNIDLGKLDGISDVVSAGTGAGTGTKEVATVEFVGLLHGESEKVSDGTNTTTITATAGDLSAAQVASAFIAAGLTNYTAVAGATADEAVLTATTNGNKTDLALTAMVAPGPGTITTSSFSAGTPSSPPATEVDTVTFTGLSDGQTETIGGLTYTATGNVSAATVATAFADLPNGFNSTDVAGDPWTGSLSGFTSGDASGTQVTFTATTAGANGGVGLPGTSTGGATEVRTTTGVNSVAGSDTTVVVHAVALLEGQSETIAGRTVTAVGGDLLDSDVATAFNTGVNGSTVITGHASVSGNLSGWTDTSGGGNLLDFTSTSVGSHDITTTFVEGPQAAVVIPVGDPVIVDGSSVGGGGQLHLTDMASGGTLELTGAIHGASSVDFVSASGNTFNLILDGDIQNSDTLTVNGATTVNITTGSDALGDAPTGPSIIDLVDTSATTVTVTGNHGIDFTGSNLSAITSLDASGVDATGANAGTVGAVTFNGNGITHALTILTGNGNDVITGGTAADTINVGTGNNTVFSSGGGDTITMGADNSRYVLSQVADSTIAKSDTITDFHANTFGNGVSGAAGTGAGATPNGDTIDLSHVLGGAITGVVEFNAANAADALTFLQNTAAGPGTFAGVALDTSTGNVYIDSHDLGTADSVIHLTGVTHLTAAAFVIA